MTFGQELVVLDTTPSMFGKFFDACLKVVWRFAGKTFFIYSFEGQTFFGMPRGAEMSLALIELQ